MPRRHANPQSLNAKQRRAKIVELWQSGECTTQMQLAATLGVAQSTISEDMAAMIGEWKGASIEWINQERKRDAGRLESMFLALWADMVSGNVAAIGKGIDILARKAKLLGLDAPERVEQTGYGGGPIEVSATLRDAARMVAIDEGIPEDQALREIVEWATANPGSKR